MAKWLGTRHMALYASKGEKGFNLIPEAIRKDEENEIEISYDFHAYREEAVMTLRNGDPGYPAEEDCEKTVTEIIVNGCVLKDNTKNAADALEACFANEIEADDWTLGIQDDDSDDYDERD